ncbi:MAG: UDP-N-acetylmuramoyl-L-alanyl-D-glutamate--2,6-diaminopimelate ligase [Oscillospiraceae bacterium]|jgi:UDP-N-acetylmuramoyl-L-alanyl-D-glutamate--2,6-diaminopimelate ligase|nr:UDP-N-acetylmuramoyl-L-alanyl-D-glutamate--2,6-diaminopimelate ligase [Oscillospiraceae bacterium]
MKLYELLASAGLEAPSGLREGEVTLVTGDSRKAVPGTVFVCIKGQHFDGHQAAGEALRKGACCVIAQRDTGLREQVLVQDTRAAYSLLCAAFFGFPARSLRLVGITGTNGKTTTAFLLKQIFDFAGVKTGLIGTLANMVGEEEFPSVLTTPDPWELQALFARMAWAGCRICFMEVSSQALAQRRVYGLEFEAAVFSNLTQDHLDYHGSFEAYFEAKRQLFLQCKTGIVNADDPAGLQMLEGSQARAVSYSIHRDCADYTAKNVRLNPEGVLYELVGKGLIGRLRFGVPGQFSVYNSMAAACTALELGLALPDILAALKVSQGVKGRMERVAVQAPFTVLIDYAHTPDGLKNILCALRQNTQGRLIALFGCGGDRDKTKRPVMGAIAAEYADLVIVTSDNPRGEDPEAILRDILAGIKTRANVLTEVDRRKAVFLALKRAKPGDVVVLAGKGQETYQILASGKIHLDEREIVRDYFAGISQ